MEQLFFIGEKALLQSLDGPLHLWNSIVVIESVEWIENPIDMQGCPKPSTFVYGIDINDKIYAQSALKKLDSENATIKEKVSIEVEV